MDYGLADVEDLGTEARQHACQLGSKAGPVLAGHVDEKDFAHGNFGAGWLCNDLTTRLRYDVTVAVP